MKTFPFGDHALFVDLEIDEAPDRAARTHAAAAHLRAALPDADIVVGAGTLLVHGVSPWDSLDPLVADAVRMPLGQVPGAAEHRIRVVYDGPDLDEVARTLGISRAEVAARHSSPSYVVELCGFLPGFAYIGPLAPELVLGRRASPRARVPAGSVGIAGAHTGIYPSVSPGGWHLLGRAIDVVLFDPRRTPPGLFRPGDTVRFEPVELS
jgi:KipI family sensor histidine kinase inhibitor